VQLRLRPLHQPHAEASLARECAVVQRYSTLAASEERRAERLFFRALCAGQVPQLAASQLEQTLRTGLYLEECVWRAKNRATGDSQHVIRTKLERRFQLDRPLGEIKDTAGSNGLRRQTRVKSLSEIGWPLTAAKLQRWRRGVTRQATRTARQAACIRSVRERCELRRGSLQTETRRVGEVLCGLHFKRKVQHYL